MSISNRELKENNFFLDEKVLRVIASQIEN